MRILGIETSCDETAVALLSVTGSLKAPKLKVLKNLVSSQIKIHRKTGGVVPEVAARQHAEIIVPLMKRALGQTVPDVIAATSGPGLITALRTGLDAARIFSIVKNIPIVGVNHLEGHIYANWLGHETRSAKHATFPALCLIVSGGHTELVLMKDHGKYKKLGATRDDAAGEAFDKTAKLLGLPYPGGPEVARLASGANPFAYSFPRPMMQDDTLDFSFSGLKTAVRTFAHTKGKMTRKEIKDTCAGVEAAIVDVLVAKTIRAAKQYKVKSVILAGGVSANLKLRETLGAALRAERIKASYHIPPLEYTGDNAAMIAAAGFFHATRKDFSNPLKLEATSNWELGIRD